MARPRIPATLKRRVLLESGHRCAIHTCRHPDVEIHHIIPWSDCQEHEYGNLIALCPNCHTRAGRGEIDRQSLFACKERLRLGFGIESLPEGQLQCETIHLIDTRNAASFNINLEIPRLTPENEEISQVNATIKAELVKDLHELRSVGGIPPDLILCNDARCELSCRFKVSYLNNDLVSISIEHYRDSCPTGAAHPNHWSTVFNYNLQPAFPIFLHNIFSVDETIYLKFISDFAIEELKANLIDDSVSQIDNVNDSRLQCILNGAGPKIQNFQKFRITKSSLIFMFDEYQVAEYVAGALEVAIPFGAIEHLVSENSAIHKAFQPLSS